MKKYFFILFIFVTIIQYNYSQSNNQSMPEKISKTEIKIGEKVDLKITAPDMKDTKVLWEEMYSAPLNATVFSKKDYFKDNNLYLEINFTLFETGKHTDFYFTIPIIQADGEIAYITTESYTITVINPISNEEIENIKNIKDPSTIKLKNEKLQAKMPFIFSFYIKIILLIIAIIVLALVAYYFFYKYVIMKKGNDFETIPPFQKFLIKLEKIIFEKNETRKETEKKLSEITEALKELIYDDFSFNAPSETTKELIITMQKNDFNHEIIKEIKDLFDEIDMIKFAKAPIIFDNLKEYHFKIKSLGIKIHDYKASLMTPQEEINENLQTR